VIIKIVVREQKNNERIHKQLSLPNPENNFKIDFVRHQSIKFQLDTIYQNNIFCLVEIFSTRQNFDINY